MAIRRFSGGWRRRTAACGLAALLLASACSAPAAAPDTTARQIQSTLDGRAAAVLRHDERGYLDAVDPAAGTLRDAQRAEFGNLRQVPLSAWAYRVTGLSHTGARASARVELSYRVDGYDSAPVVSARVVELGERAGRWYVTSDRPDEGAAQPLWQQGPVTVLRGTHSLVLGVGQDRALLQEIARTEDRAVPAVSAAWPGRWAGKVVVLVPASLDSMAALLGAPAASYRGIAAVTTGEAGASAAAPADRVIVNPEAYGVLGDLGKQVVLTHETTHVATRARTSPATPMWLSEGYADWVGYRGTGRTAAQAAPELQQAVRRGELPDELPLDADFGFEGGADRLARAYEGGWLACSLIAQRWGEDRLAAFYAEVGGQKHREGAVEKAMNDELGTTPREFTALWRAYVRDRLA
ncbi:hypothetical protein AB0G73_20680 [Streptomyces sp. NPDC020719]|uniref:hypothetical protein n=1 Tax=unclassified Streptomyces TaxID=2593676 RepID=UPI00340EE239